MKNLTVILTIILGLTFVQCSDETKNSIDCNNFGLSIQKEALALVDAANKYSENATVANCQAYRTALLDYID